MTDQQSTPLHQETSARSSDDQDNHFDFDRHRQAAIDDFQLVRPQYEKYAAALQDIIEESLTSRNIIVSSVESRVKEVESFGNKAALPSNDDPSAPRYRDPLRNITDLAGIRIITYFPNTLQDVHELIHDEFHVSEHTDHSESLIEDERFGYKSQHYLIRMSSARTELTEYSAYENLIAEVQVRTILQHAWAEIEHDIQYKSSSTTPSSLRRRIMALAGLLEIADREFQAIQDEDTRLTQSNKQSLALGRLEQVEITSSSLRTYLDGKLGSDGRVSDASYESTARLLRHLGFAAFDQVQECIDGYNDDELSRLQWGSRQGPIWRFHSLLLAGMGENFIAGGPKDPELRQFLKEVLQSFEAAGVEIHNYAPQRNDASDESEGRAPSENAGE